MADKVLVVDDDKAILTMLHKALKSNGIENDLAISGEAALDLLESNQYDLILLDINMRGINGFEVIQRIRSKGLTTPVMVVSGRKEDQDALYGLEIGRVRSRTTHRHSGSTRTVKRYLCQPKRTP